MFFENDYDEALLALKDAKFKLLSYGAVFTLSILFLLANLSGGIGITFIIISVMLGLSIYYTLRSFEEYSNAKSVLSILSKSPQTELF